MESFMKAWLTKYRIIVFLVLTLIASWYPWYIGGHGYRVWGPSLAGLIVVAVTEGRKGLGDMVRRLFRWRVGLVWWAVALLGPVVLTLVAIGVHVLTGGEAPSLLFWKEEWYMAPVLMVFLLLPLWGGPGGEEPFGWRGYMQPKLQEKWGQWGPLMTSIIIGLAWGVWHLPEFYNPTSTQYAIGIGFSVPMIVMWTSLSIVMTWLYNKTNGSVLLSGVVYHLMVDFSQATLLADFSMAGMSEGIPQLDLRLLTTSIGVFALVALVLVIATRGRIGWKEH